MKNKLLVALILVMITLGTIGYSFACNNGGVHVNCCPPPSCNCDVRFTTVITSGNETERDVANIHAQIAPNGDTIQTCMTNAYPCYEAYRYIS
jgi:hypothetical protein